MNPLFTALLLGILFFTASCSEVPVARPEPVAPAKPDLGPVQNMDRNGKEYLLGKWLETGVVKADSTEGRFLLALSRTEEGRDTLEAMGYYAKPVVTIRAKHEAVEGVLELDDDWTPGVYRSFRSVLRFEKRIGEGLSLLVFVGRESWAYTFVDTFVVNREYSVVASHRDSFRNQGVTDIRYNSRSMVLTYIVEPEVLKRSRENAQRIQLQIDLQQKRISRLDPPAIPAPANRQDAALPGLRSGP